MANHLLPLGATNLQPEYSGSPLSVSPQRPYHVNYQYDSSYAAYSGEDPQAGYYYSPSEKSSASPSSLEAHLVHETYDCVHEEVAVNEDITYPESHYLSGSGPHHPPVVAHWLPQSSQAAGSCDADWHSSQAHTDGYYYAPPEAHDHCYDITDNVSPVSDGYATAYDSPGHYYRECEPEHAHDGCMSLSRNSDAYSQEPQYYSHVTPGSGLTTTLPAPVLHEQQHQRVASHYGTTPQYSELSPHSSAHNAGSGIPSPPQYVVYERPASPMDHLPYDEYDDEPSAGPSNQDWQRYRYTQHHIGKSHSYPVDTGHVNSQAYQPQARYATYPTTHVSHQHAQPAYGYTTAPYYASAAPTPPPMTLPVAPPVRPSPPRSPPLVEDTPKKPLTLACFFCRKRKIACGSPPPGQKDRTCNQCKRRNLTCEYPVCSRRGMRPRPNELDGLMLPPGLIAMIA